MQAVLFYELTNFIFLLLRHHVRLMTTSYPHYEEIKIHSTELRMMEKEKKF